MSVTRIDVGGDRPYQVVVGTGVLGELPSLVGDKARTVVVISPECLAAIVHPVRGALEAAGYLVRAETVPTGEAHLFRIRVTCKDRAGNEASHERSEPVNTDLFRPGVDGVDVKPGVSTIKVGDGR